MHQGDGVASTLRDAHVRDYRCVLLEDGGAAFDFDLHDATIASLSGISEKPTRHALCDDIQAGAG